MNSINIVYMISNIFGIYVIYKFMNIFFNTNEVNRKLEVLSYIFYYIVIGLAFLFFNKPSMYLIINILMFYLITLNYPSTLKLKLTATILTYVILAILEAFAVITVSFLNINIIALNDDLQMIIVLISSKIFSFVIILALSNFKLVKESIIVSPQHWLSIIIIPIGTLISTIILISVINDNNLLLINISVIIMFMINILVFYLYDSIVKFDNEKMENVILQQQNNAYCKQFELINQSQENIKILRHDLKNHITSLQIMIEKKDNKSALSYLKKIYDYVNCSNEYAKSGNSEVDSILNYKINEAVKYGINVNLNLSIPKKLNIHLFDLSVVLGNIIDNAIRATINTKEEKEICISIEYERNVLYLSMINPFNGNVSYKNSELETTHNDIENHGIGLKSVKKSIERYNGVLDIYYTDNMFYTDLLLYNPVNNLTK